MNTNGKSKGNSDMRSGHFTSTVHFFANNIHNKTKEKTADVLIANFRCILTSRTLTSLIVNIKNLCHAPEQIPSYFQMGKTKM